MRKIWHSVLLLLLFVGYSVLLLGLNVGCALWSLCVQIVWIHLLLIGDHSEIAQVHHCVIVSGKRGKGRVSRRIGIVSTIGWSGIVHWLILEIGGWDGQTLIEVVPLIARFRQIISHHHIGHLALHLVRWSDIHMHLRANGFAVLTSERRKSGLTELLLLMGAAALCRRERGRIRHTLSAG